MGISTGTILVGVAILTVVIAYLAQPFLRPTGDVDRRIEAWVAERRAERRRQAQAAQGASSSRFCPQCGRPVDISDRFCRACGTHLGEVEDE